MEIIRQIQELIWWVVRQAVLFVAFVIWAALFPLVLFAWHQIPMSQPAKLLLAFELLPFAAYAPVILLWVTRSLRGREA